MGMKIDDIIQSLTAMKSVIGVNQLTINEAVDTMRKYQKIEQIVTEWNKYRQDISCGFGDGVYMQMVGKVIEDGKV